MKPPPRSQARCPRGGRSQWPGAAPLAADEGPREAGIGGARESALEADAHRVDLACRANEADALRN